jgi:two-component system, NtrC family, sensor kinase
MIWFLLLSLVPLMFVTGYSLVKYEQAIDNELVQRLRANAREFAATMDEYEKYLDSRSNRYKSDQALSLNVLTDSLPQVRQQIQTLVRASVLNISVSVFNRDGQMIASYAKDDLGNARVNAALENANLSLRDDYIEKLKKSGRLSLVDSGPKNSVDLISYTRLDAKNGRLAGYVEEIANIGPNFLENLKKRLNLEIILFDGGGNILAGSHPDFLLYAKDSFGKTIGSGEEVFFDLTVRSEPFGFITMPVKWGESRFLVGLGASKQRARAFVRNVNYAFFTMVGAIGILLIFTSIVATRVIVRPVNELVEAIQAMDVRDAPVSIPLSTDTELGVLTESFNEMSRRMYQAKAELEAKITELEAAYGELKDTQARLVHSAKMASLGQLVAGIAHELNNPIGFIYSNMSHLRDYSQRMMKIIETAEKNPKDLSKAKAETDFSYVVEDLPRLISSCEDGARRTRDIVLGLRSFSRLEEAHLKRVSLKDGIEDTLRLIAGELKNRVRVHLDIQTVPEVLCYASQLNQVFMNILANAAQAIEGEGDIWIKLSHQKASGANPARAQISIRDSGKGMSSEIVDKIFDPFFTTKTVGQGTGLGLSISYGIVKKHGGDIVVRSEPGKGTEFQISIPVDGPPGADAATA